jgi:type II secretory pathway pseudopilin PulG
MRRKSHYELARLSRHSGMSLLETMIALVILIIATVGILTLGMVATGTTENQGHLAARTSEYAQDKLEQLISLAWTDTTSDTTVLPIGTSGTGLSVGGSSDPSSPTTGYVDYLDNSGNLLTITSGVAPSNWFYIRVWQISIPDSTNYPNLKQITVTAKVKAQVGAPQGALPRSTLTTLKSNPF